MMQHRQVGVLGLGKWGMAISTHLARKGYEVVAWARREKEIDSTGTVIQQTQAITELQHLSSIVLALPSHALDSSAELLQRLQPNALVVSAVKGFSPEALTPIQKVSAMAPQLTRLAALGGPLFAHELRDGKVSSLVVAAEAQQDAQEAADLFEGSHLRMYLSQDPHGVELGGIFKNVIALAIGVSDGIGLGDAARASFFVHGLSEMTTLAQRLGANPASLYGLSGVGDLVMTATCDSSRNRRVGKLLGSGKSLEEALQEIGETAEGVRTARFVVEMAQEAQVEVPITTGLVELLDGHRSPRQFVEALLEGPQRWEGIPI